MFSQSPQTSPPDGSLGNAAASTSSGSGCHRPEASDSGTAACTLPAPLACAPSRASRAAPRYRSLPATTSTRPRWYFMAARGCFGCGSELRSASRTCSTGWAWKRSRRRWGTPASMRCTWPTWSRAASCTSPRFTNPTVSVAWATAALPSRGLPLSPSSPAGRSRLISRPGWCRWRCFRSSASSWGRARVCPSPNSASIHSAGSLGSGLHCSSGLLSQRRCR